MCWAYPKLYDQHATTTYEQRQQQQQRGGTLYHCTLLGPSGYCATQLNNVTLQNSVIPAAGHAHAICAAYACACWAGQEKQSPLWQPTALTAMQRQAGKLQGANRHVLIFKHAPVCVCVCVCSHTRELVPSTIQLALNRAGHESSQAKADLITTTANTAS